MRLGGACVYNLTKHTFLARRITLADSLLTRLVGLLGKRSMEQASCLWLVPSKSIHTIGMLFPIDVVLINESFRVVGLRSRMPPFSLLLPNFCATSVLEFPAHTILGSRTEIGDELRIEPHRVEEEEQAASADLRCGPANPPEKR